MRQTNGFTQSWGGSAKILRYFPRTDIRITDVLWRSAGIVLFEAFGSLWRRSLGPQFERFLSDWVLPPKLKSCVAQLVKKVRNPPNETPFPTARIRLDGNERRKSASLFELRTARPGDVLWVPLEVLRSVLGAAFTWEQNHYVRYLRGGGPSLRRFYDIHQPGNPMEMLFLEMSNHIRKFPLDTTKLWDPPWQRLHSRSPSQVLDNQWFGPVNQTRFDEEIRRTDEVFRSISESGLWFKETDNISYRLLVLDTDPGDTQHRIIVTDGNHRVAVLAHLGWSMIPIEPLMDFVGEVRLSDLEEWPGVLDGTFSVGEAERYFRAFYRAPHQVFLPAW